MESRTIITFDSINFHTFVTWMYLVVILYIFCPIFFLLISPKNKTNRRSFVSNFIQSIWIEQRVKYTLISSIFTLFIIILVLIFMGSSNAFNDFLIFIALLLFPVSTFLIALLWYPAKQVYKLRTLVLAMSIWLIVRICFVGVFFIGRVSEFRDYVLVPQLNQVPGQDYYIPASVFGGSAGLIVCLTVSFASILIAARLVRQRPTEVKYLAFAACLCPTVFLIFGSFALSFGWMTIDFAIAALTFGWLLSAKKQPKSAAGDDSSEDQIRNSPNYDHAVQTHGKDKKWNGRVVTVFSSLPSAILSISGFVFTATIPAILLKWVFHEMIEFRLDGSAGSWSMVWTVALGLGLTTFAVARFSESRHQTGQIAVAAFLCAFAIMIFDPADDAKSFAVVFTMPVLVLGMLAQIATVVLDNHRWSWPFWACYLFIYIFVHSMSASGYATDLSRLDLFSWINMSVIVFVFLFVIPAYFASDRCQPQTLAMTSLANSHD